MKHPIKYTLPLIAAGLCAALAMSCGRSEPAPSSEAVQTTSDPATPYAIVATVGMVGDIVRHVVGEHATVKNIIGTGVDPHLYKPTRNDVVALQGADVIFYSGLLLEGKMGDVLIKVARTKPVFAVTELIPQEFVLEPAEFAGHPDPHVWMDIAGWMKAVEAVNRSLAEFDPANSDMYAANAERYLGELAALDTYAKDVIATIPKAGRMLITAHDAFNYFGRAYDIDVQGIQGISTESSAGLQDIRRLVDIITERDIKAVFIESSVPDKNVRALIEGAAARGKTVTVGGELYSDAMGNAGSYEGTYIGMLDHNITLVTRALGGQAPEKGLNGKLNLSH
ncbi:MAG: zinc ABC transporter substrate-binding protein [Kiritimatiellae bacterium]|nr:zinc ABC transporter substrate-binding protein [Kiritimatiellia bacterium]